VVPESGKPTEPHLNVDCDKQALNNVRQSLFSDFEANCIDSTLPPDTRHLLQPKSEHKDVTDSSSVVHSSCSDEQTGSGVCSTDNVQSIIVKLPLVIRLRHNKHDTLELCIKTEITGDSEPAAQSVADDALTTEGAESDIKKETTAAAKGLQLARETIASIFGTEVQPCTIMKIPIKRRAERDSDDAKYSQTSRSDDLHDHSSNKKRKVQHWYVLELLYFSGN